MQQISTHQLADWIAECGNSGGEGGQERRQKPFLLDVREPWEYEHCHLAGSVLMPMQSVPARLGELAPDADVVVICHHGGRSMQVALFLEKNGFANVHNLSGGMEAWSTTVDPSVPHY